MQNWKAVTAPLDNNVKITKDMCSETQQKKSEMKNFPYRQLIGSLISLSVAIRPDIPHAVNFLS